MKKHKLFIYNLMAMALATSLLVSCSNAEYKDTNNKDIVSVEATDNKESSLLEEVTDASLTEDGKANSKDKITENSSSDAEKSIFDGYKIIEVDGETYLVIESQTLPLI